MIRIKKSHTWGMPLRQVILGLTTLVMLTPTAFATEVYALPEPGDNIVGEMQSAVIEPGDTLTKIAQRYDIGLAALLRANPDINPNRLRAWKHVKIPTAYILPPEQRRGIVINISEMRLFYYPENENIVITAPIAVGREGWETPLAATKIVEKTQDPTWRVPQSIRQASAEKGKYLPEVVPPGPDNPLGQYAMRLSLGSYLIHGTNNPSSIGQRVSSGCIRMYPSDIEYLFNQVPVGTPVKIINQPYKVGRYQGKYYIEAHSPVDNSIEAKEGVQRDYRTVVEQSVGDAGHYLEWDKIDPMVQQHRGYPQRIL
jgi:L,D-transpeptidase ErfK/SrfK